MNCPNCESTHASKNGHRRGKQNYICRDCGRQFVESYSPKGYADEIKERCLSMYVNGNGFRAIERLTGVNHNTVINWVKKAAIPLADAPDYSEIPEIAQIDELQTFVGKKNKIWLWTAVNKGAAGILAIVLGDRSAETFKPLWKILRGWQCFLYVTDGYGVYPCFINDADHLVSKTYMTRVEGENTRLRHYLARLHRRTLCYSKTEEMLRLSIKLLLHYLKDGVVPLPL
jgi:IS1 family transposase